MKKILTLVTLSLLSQLSFAVSLQSMNKSQITTLLQQKTVTTVNLVTLNQKLINNTMTIYFDDKGHVTGQLTNNVSDSDPQIDSGTWTVDGSGALCAKWKNWNNSKPMCVYVYDLANGVLFLNKDTNSFESLVLKTNIKGGNHLQSYVS